MTKLDGGDKAEAETLLGELDDEELADISERNDRWGHVGFACLEALMVRHSSMVADPLVTRIEGDAQWDWRKNLEALGKKISSLALLLAGELDAAPSEAQAKLLKRASATAGQIPTVAVTDYVVDNDRLMSSRSSRHGTR